MIQVILPDYASSAQIRAIYNLLDAETKGIREIDGQAFRLHFKCGASQPILSTDGSPKLVRKMHKLSRLIRVLLDTDLKVNDQDIKFVKTFHCYRNY